MYFTICSKTKSRRKTKSVTPRKNRNAPTFRPGTVNVNGTTSFNDTTAASVAFGIGSTAGGRAAIRCCGKLDRNRDGLPDEQSVEYDAVGGTAPSTAIGGHDGRSRAKTRCIGP
jgi:hypothetical protein